MTRHNDASEALAPPGALPRSPPDPPEGLPGQSEPAHSGPRPMPIPPASRTTRVLAAAFNRLPGRPRSWLLRLSSIRLQIEAKEQLLMADGDPYWEEWRKDLDDFHDDLLWRRSEGKEGRPSTRFWGEPYVSQLGLFDDD